MTHLYSNFFERYCQSPVVSIGNDCQDGEIGSLCYMLWDVFVVYPGNASPGMIAAGLAVMRRGIWSTNDNCIASAIHGLGHWASDVPAAVDLLREWLLHPTTANKGLLEYAEQAMTGCVL